MDSNYSSSDSTTVPRTAIFGAAIFQQPRAVAEVSSSCASGETEIIPQLVHGSYSSPSGERIALPSGERIAVPTDYVVAHQAEARETHAGSIWVAEPDPESEAMRDPSPPSPLRSHTATPRLYISSGAPEPLERPRNSGEQLAVSRRSRSGRTRLRRRSKLPGVVRGLPLGTRARGGSVQRLAYYQQQLLEAADLLSRHLGSTTPPVGRHVPHQRCCGLSEW